MNSNFDLTEYKYFKPIVNSIGFFGTNHIFLLHSRKDYYLSQDTVYQIIQKYDTDMYADQKAYLIRDLKKMETHILMIYERHDLNTIKKYFKLYEKK